MKRKEKGLDKKVKKEYNNNRKEKRKNKGGLKCGEKFTQTLFTVKVLTIC